jgi:hypothetical protein
MHPMPFLFAAGFDWLEGLAGSAVLVIWVISQVINVIRAAATRPDPQAAPPARPKKPPRRRAAASPRAEVDRQIEEFLRGSRAGGRAGTDAPSRPPPLPRSGAGRPREAAAADRRPVREPLQPDFSGSDISRHVADAFATDLDHLSSGLTAASAGYERREQPATAAAELAAALRSPATLRQLFLLRAVLERPTERW